MPEKQDLRVRRTHKLLYNAFVELIVEKSFDEISITDICEKAMVNRATFYKHFDDKYEFFCFCVKRMLQRVESKNVFDHEKDDVLSYSIKVVNALLEFLKENKNVISSAIKNQDEYVVTQMMHDILYESTMNSLKYSEKCGKKFVCPVEVLCEVLIGSSIAMTKWAFRENENYTNEEMIEFLLNISKDLELHFNAVYGSKLTDLLGK